MFDRWKKKGHQDVVVECERFAVDVTSTSSREDSCYTGGLRSRSSTMSTASGPASAIDQQVDVQLQQQLRYTTNTDKEFWSPTAYFLSQHSSSPPPLPEVCTPASIPQTPNSQVSPTALHRLYHPHNSLFSICLLSNQIPNSQNFVVNSSFPHQEGTSPPEAAIEATPETTPIKVNFH